MPPVSGLDTPGATEKLDGLHALMVELEEVLQTVVLNDSTIIDALVQMLGTLQQMQTRNEQGLGRLADEVGGLAATIEGLAAQPGHRREAPEAASADPEIALLTHLHSYLANPVALDIGANVGRMSGALLEAGYEVFAFEPYAAARDALLARIGRDPALHVFPYALGAGDGDGALHIAADHSGSAAWDTTLYHSLVAHPMLDDLRFSGTEPVRIRSLASLAAAGEIPGAAGVLKIDTEGHDMQVIAGMGGLGADVVMTEFWDSEHPFGRDGHSRLADAVAELRRRGFRWHLTIYRVDPTKTLAFHANRTISPPQSWGNALFFRDHGLFARALEWCEQHLG